ncbi:MULTISPECIES: hypothetical protein [Micromonospora]|uniref:hypothetical protein n=1 Tax=Micromonospora TaxID=1873 RepID=UPI000B8215F4|nr:hypothetical protein [Micromonospora yangpuensis]
MSGAAGDGLRGALLTGLALVTLVAGGVWWQANAPGPATVGPSELTRSEPGRTSQVVTVDPGTGQVVDGPRRVLVYDGYPGVGLARFAETVWRDRVTIRPDDPVRWDFDSREGRRYLLQYRCTGAGQLVVWASRGRASEAERSTCDGSLTGLELSGEGRRLRLRLAVSGPAPAEVQIQLVTLP